jgi:hypothetical protein
MALMTTLKNVTVLVSSGARFAGGHSFSLNMLTNLSPDLLSLGAIFFSLT